ncbi:hypothetical protein [Alienimonas sp. DA493]|uniref:hypothetical protein n=1 Tax=Alienimonas sp. DA493 TaxID=3373605 RepID=UPI003754ECF3
MSKPTAPALLAPSWSACLCGPAAGPGRRANRQALLFDLEGRLPVAAEGLAADFLPVPRPETPGAAWGVAAPAEGLGPAVAALEEGGTPVGSITPLALLAGPGEPQPRTISSPAVTVWQTADGLELVEHAAGAPRGWARTARDPAAAARVLHALALTRPEAPRVVLRVPDETLAAELRGRLAGAFEVSEPGGPSFEEAAAAGAAWVLAGKADPPVDLRTGPLADPDPLRAVRGPLRALGASLALSLLAVTAALLWRADRLEKLAADRQIAAEEAFRDLFPGQRAPLAVLSRLQSERAAAAGLRGAAGAAPASPDAVATLAAVLAALPPAEDLTLRLDDVRVEGQRADLSGAVKELGDVAKVAAALRAAGLTVPPPRSGRSGQEVTFVLAAERPLPDAGAEE